LEPTYGVVCRLGVDPELKRSRHGAAAIADCPNESKRMPFKMQAIHNHRRTSSDIGGLVENEKKSTNDPQMSEIGSDYGAGHAADNRSEKLKNNMRITSNTL